jgi:hypothetical protein
MDTRSTPDEPNKVPRVAWPKNSFKISYLQPADRFVPAPRCPPAESRVPHPDSCLWAQAGGLVQLIEQLDESQTVLV